MKLTLDTDSYNERRYGRPWIATVDFTNGARGEFAFGEWAGQDGDAGSLYLDCEIGDVVAKGQKDFRKPRNSAPDYYLVCEGKKLEHVSKADAYRHWLSRQHTEPADTNPLAEITTDDLLAELARRGVNVEV